MLLAKVYSRVSFKMMVFSRLSQILKNEGYLAGGKDPLGTAVPSLCQGFGKLGIVFYPVSQSVQGRTWRKKWRVCFGQFAFVIRSDFHDLWCFVTSVKILIISEMYNIFPDFVSHVLISPSVPSLSRFRFIVSL